MTTKTIRFCAACGGTQEIRTSIWHSPNFICRPCFSVWYDPPVNIDVTDPAAVGALSLKLKAEGKWPWVERSRA